MNAKNFGLVMTSLFPVRTQSHNANAPVFVWREVSWRDAFATEMLNAEHNMQSQFICIRWIC